MSRGKHKTYVNQIENKLNHGLDAIVVVVVDIGVNKTRDVLYERRHRLLLVITVFLDSSA